MAGDEPKHESSSLLPTIQSLLMQTGTPGVEARDYGCRQNATREEFKLRRLFKDRGDSAELGLDSGVLKS